MTEEIIARLRSLDLSDSGSHSRLSAIASCFYQPTFGWTRGACEELRNVLIETLEDADGNNDNDNSDDCSRTYNRCDQHGRQVSYDVLGNERHKAIANLRLWEPDKSYDNDKYGEIQIRLLYQLLDLGGAMMMDGTDAAKKVRDRLIFLLGGDECNFSGVESYMDDMGEKSNPAETSDESTDHVTLATPSSEDETCPNPVRGASIIDKLGNERQKSIAELREIQTDAGGFVKALANALDVEWQAPRVHQTIAEVRDRLIHLLGGDQPTLSDLYGIWKDGEKSESRSAESVSEMTKSAEIDEFDEHVRQLEHDVEMWRDRAEDMRMERDELQIERDELLAKLDELHGHSRTCPESGDGVSMSAPSVPITDQLREWVSCCAFSKDRESLTQLADEIDAKSNRICQQRGHWHQQATDMMNRADAMEHERDELQQTIDELTVELDSARAKNRRLTWHIDQMQGGSKKWREKCDELQAQVIECCKQRDKARAEVVNLRDAYYRTQRCFEQERDELQEKNRHLAEKCDAMLVLFGNWAMDAKSDQEQRTGGIHGQG